MEFRVLGPLQVLSADSRELPLGGAKQRATLAMLLLRRNEVVTSDQLIDGLWGDSPPPTAGSTLKTYVSRLRRVLTEDGEGARLVARPRGYRLRVEPDELDLARFETLLLRARSLRAAGDVTAARGCLIEALSTFTGTPLQGLTHVPFAPGEIGHLEELRLGALELRLEADLATGRHTEVIAELEALVARFPFREVLWGDLMLALYRAGRQGDALMAFDRARRTLSDELGVDPGQALQELHRRILQQDPSLELAIMPSRRGVVTSAAAQPSNTLMDTAVSALGSTPPMDAHSTSLAAVEGKPHRRRLLLGRGRLLMGVSGAVALALLAILIPHVVGGGGAPSVGFPPGTVLIDLKTGKEVRSIRPAELAVTAYPVFASGHFWVNNWSPSAYVEIDPSSGAILKQISPPARDPNVHRDFATVTPYTVQGNALWVNSGDDLVKMDIALGREVDRFKLDDVGQGSGLAEGVAVGGGSVWVSRDVGRGQVLRLNPVAGTSEHVWNDVTPYLNLAYGDGSLWMADERGIARIDGETNVLSVVNGIQNNCGGGNGGCVVAGGGFGWTDDGSKGATYKVDRAGHIAATYPTGIGSAFLSYRDDVL